MSVKLKPLKLDVVKCMSNKLSFPLLRTEHHSLVEDAKQRGGETTSLYMIDIKTIESGNNKIISVSLWQVVGEKKQEKYHLYCAHVLFFINIWLTTLRTNTW